MTELKQFTAILLRGKRRGQRVILSTWANDWAILDGGSSIPLTSLQFEDTAIDRVITQQKQDHDENTHKRLGQMFSFYYDYDHFVETGKFKKGKNNVKTH